MKKGVGNYFKWLFTNKWTYILALILFIITNIENNGLGKFMGRLYSSTPEAALGEILAYILFSAVIITLGYMFKELIKEGFFFGIFQPIFKNRGYRLK